MSLVSVTIAIHNCEKYIQKSLESILYQTHTELEILICDDCSSDNTWNLLSNYKDARITLFRNDENKGVVYTRNFLLSQAKGEFILIQDGDDWSNEKRIEILLNQFTANPDLDACATAHYRVDNKNQISASVKQGSACLSIDDCFQLPFMPFTLMLKHHVYKQLGGYHPFFSGLFGEDWYWVVRMVEKHKVYYLDVPLYYYRFNPQSITNTVGRKEKLIVPDLMIELINQRKQQGTDWVEQSNKSAIANFTAEKFADKKWLSEKYRVEAAVQRDGEKRGLALQLILKALACNPFAFKNYKTLRYVLFK